ncbi:hypothetical protein HMPREF3293_03163 [Christensenella minuta]|uniref:Uncharacterized protein n=1 Tax=Christensenella minuta TaxID=626937 RepID=A0A136Q0B7_9FIRM|nr:hypothetical protein HMPREF3293_03163 [Christensenella minuta]
MIFFDKLPNISNISFSFLLFHLVCLCFDYNCMHFVCQPNFHKKFKILFSFFLPWFYQLYSPY